MAIHQGALFGHQVEVAEPKPLVGLGQKLANLFLLRFGNLEVEMAGKEHGAHLLLPD